MDALVAKSLSKTYHARQGTVKALDNVDMVIRKGQLFGFLGRNGAGKTTFIKIAAGLLLPTSGSMELFGIDVLRQPREVRERIAIVPQEGKPFYHLTPREHIEEYLRVRGRSAEAAKSIADELLDAMGLEAYSHLPAMLLSGGLQQRTLVAMVLATGADFLFLDEPTLGMDPFARRQVWDVIRRAARNGSTVLITTHYLDEAEQLRRSSPSSKADTFSTRGPRSRSSPRCGERCDCTSTTASHRRSSNPSGRSIQNAAV